MRILTQTPARWLPAILTAEGPAGPQMGWLHLEQERFLKPFLVDDCQEAMRRPVNAAFQPSTSLAELRRLADSVDSSPLCGLVFHVSRCGSTLIAQTLARAPDALVLSEPPVLNALLRINDSRDVISRDEQVASLRALVKLMGQRRFVGQERLYIKLDAWHFFYRSLIAEAFPEAPQLTLYRDPVEVMVSQLRQRGLFTCPGYLPREQVKIAEDETPTALDYLARVLGALYREALLLNPTGERLVNYSELPSALLDRLPALLGFELDAAHRAAVDEASSLHSKRGEAFSPDTASKQAEAEPQLLDAVRAHLMGPYAELEGRRTSWLDSRRR